MNLIVPEDGGSFTRYNGAYTVWDSGNDGSGSGLDADLLDGQHGSHYLNYNNLTNKPTIPTNNNQLTNGAGYITSSGNTSGTAGGLSGTPNITVGTISSGAITSSGVIESAVSGNVKLIADGSTHANVEIDRGNTSSHNNLLFRTAGTVKWRIWQDGADNILKVRNEAASANVLTFTDTNSAFAGNITITGGNSDGSGNAFVVNRGGNSQQQALRVENSGEVVVSNNYLYASQSGTSFYSQGDVVVRGNLRNDSNSGADLLKVSDKLNVTGDIQSNGTVILTSSGRNLQNIGNITATGNLNLGADDTTPQINMLFDDHGSGTGWDTRIEIGKSDDLTAGTRVFPTYVPAGAYGMQVQANSDGVFFEMEEYSTGNFRPIIQWGDDDTDTPFRIKDENGSEFTVSYNGICTATTRLSAPTLYSTVATGTAPLTVTSTTLVSNLNADRLDGQHGSYYTNASNLSSGTIPTARLFTSASGDWFRGGPPIVATDGVMEIGRYIDFHNTDTTTADYDVRLDANTANSLNVTGVSTTDGLRVEGNKVFHAGNDGASSGLDADLLDGQHGSYYAQYNHFRSLGSPAFTAGGGSNDTLTTAQYISEMEGDGAFDSFTSGFKTTWSYAGNDNLSDAGSFGPTETAGMAHLTWTDNASDSYKRKYYSISNCTYILEALLVEYMFITIRALVMLQVGEKYGHQAQTVQVQV